MTGTTVNGRNGSEARSGARTLNLLAAPLNSQILKALRDGPKQPAELRLPAGHPALTTLRGQLKKLVDAGTIEKRRRNRFPGALEYRLSETGSDLMPVVDALERWLERAPQGPLGLGGPPAKAAIKALTDGWSTAMLRALGAKPLTLTELDRVISSMNYPSLERRLSAMRLAGLVDANEGDGRGTPYDVTAWARLAVGPLVAASRWERRHAPSETPPVAKLDVEAAFLLAADLLATPASATGTCRLTIALGDDGGPAPTGLLVSVGDGRVTARTTRLEGETDAWATGSLPAWFAAVVDGDRSGLELGGDGALAGALVDELHGALFAPSLADWERS